MAFLLVGCAAPSASLKDSTGAAASEAGAPATRVLDPVTLAPLDLESALERMAGHSLVYVGERHGDVLSHRVQLEVLEALRSRGRRLAVAIEWLPAQVQGRLDAWTRGDVPEEALLDAVGWSEHWGHTPEPYLPIFRWARQHRVSMIALGSPPGLVRRLFRKGVDGLTDEERELLPPLTSGNAPHRAFFDALMVKVAHGHAIHEEVEGTVMDRFYLAQIMRDELMAVAVVEALQSEKAEILVVLAGRGHVDHGLGIPERARAALDAPYCIVLPAESAEDDEGGTAPTQWGGRPAADLLWIPSSGGD
jgi:uncharacterized iron-regulated protein